MLDKLCIIRSSSSYCTNPPPANDPEHLHQLKAHGLHGRHLLLEGHLGGIGGNGRRGRQRRGHTGSHGRRGDSNGRAGSCSTSGAGVVESNVVEGGLAVDVHLVVLPGHEEVVLLPLLLDPVGQDAVVLPLVGDLHKRERNEWNGEKRFRM